MSAEMVFAVEPFSDAAIMEAMPLLRAHYEELWMHKDIPLSPDFQRYYAFAQAGLLHYCTARVNGELVGYCLSVLSRGLHYSTVNFATNDILFIRKDYRKGMAGMRLLRFMEEELSKMNITFIQMHIKYDPDYSPLLGKMGYDPFEKIMMKRIK